MTREEHLQWAKDRAIEYLDTGDTKNALGSMFSDLRKHPDLEGHAAIALGVQMMMTGRLETADQVRNFVLGFN